MDSENLNLYYREIVYQDPKKKKDSICGVFSYEAINKQDLGLGNLYIVGEITNIPKKKYKNSDFILNLLSSAIRRDFYSNPQRNTLEALESALQSANIYLTDFVKKGHNEWINNLHFTCLTFSGNNIHVGQTGEMIVQLFRNNTMSNISRKFETPEIPEPTKTFSNIASGEIEKGDKILISTTNISKILPSSKIKEIISSSTTDKLYHYIKNNLSESSSLACLLLDAATQKPEEAPTAIQAQVRTETRKEGPTNFGLNLRQSIDFKMEKIDQIIKDQITFPNKITIFFLKHQIIKYFLILFIGLTIIISPYLILKISYDIKIRQINELIQRTQENVERSKLSLVYQNQPEAKTFLKQATVFLENANLLFANLPLDAKNKVSNNLQLIQGLLDQQKNSLNNVINIQLPEKITDLSQSVYPFNPQGLVKLENLIYLYELNSGFLHQIDLIDNSSKLIFLSSKDTFKLGTATDNEVLLLANPEKIAVYNYNENYNIYLLKPNLENTLNIKSMTSYDDNLFFLDVQRLNVFKYSKTEDILNGSQWIMKGPTDELKDATSIAVDGDIYISLNTGKIIQYSQGKKNKELKIDISPALINAEKLFTQSDFKNLYILDKTNSRIISYNKKDGLIKQYFLSGLNNLKDFWVDYDESIIYLLNGSEVYKIEI
ncbi:MAG: hypothetical protein V1686_02400 [Patescibacteria group bacterium]